MAELMDNTPDTEAGASFDWVRRHLTPSLFRVDCPSPSDLLDFANKTLDGKTYAEVQAHLKLCRTCSSELDALRQANIQSSAGASDAASTSPGFLRSLLQAVLVPTPALVLRGEEEDVTDRLIYAIEPENWELRLQRDTDSQGYVLSGQLLGPAEDELLHMTARLTLSAQEQIIAQTTLDDTGYFVLRVSHAEIFNLTIESEHVQIAVDGILPRPI